MLFENDAAADSPPPDIAQFPAVDEPPMLARGDFRAPDGGESAGGIARRLFALSDRLFVLFVYSGAPTPSTAGLVAVNQLLGSLEVARGDFYSGEPPEFPARAGWDVGTSGPRPVLADGNFLTAWATTERYRNEWNELPPHETLEHLPPYGIVIWVGLSASNRFPPTTGPSSGFPARTPPFRLEDFERRPAWEGQVRGIPEHLLLATARREYQADVRVYFGRSEPTLEMRRDAQQMLNALRLPRWGSWERAAAG